MARGDRNSSTSANATPPVRAAAAKAAATSVQPAVSKSEAEAAIPPAGNIPIVWGDTADSEFHSQITPAYEVIVIENAVKSGSQISVLGQTLRVGEARTVRTGSPLAVSFRGVQRGSNSHTVKVTVNAPRGIADYDCMIPVPKELSGKTDDVRIIRWKSGRLTLVRIPDDLDEPVAVYCPCRPLNCKHRLAALYMVAGSKHERAETSHPGKVTLHQHRVALTAFLQERDSIPAVLGLAYTGYLWLKHAAPDVSWNDEQLQVQAQQLRDSIWTDGIPAGLGSPTLTATPSSASPARPRRLRA